MAIRADSTKETKSLRLVGHDRALQRREYLFAVIDREANFSVEEVLPAFVDTNFFPVAVAELVLPLNRNPTFGVEVETLPLFAYVGIAIAVHISCGTVGYNLVVLHITSNGPYITAVIAMLGTALLQQGSAAIGSCFVRIRVAQ